MAKPSICPTACPSPTCSSRLDLAGKRVAVELNLDIVPRSQHATTRAAATATGSKWCMPSAAASVRSPSSPVSARQWNCHEPVLPIDKPCYPGRPHLRVAPAGRYRQVQGPRGNPPGHRGHGAEIVTVAVRRTNIGQNPGEPNLLDVIAPDKYTILPNTAGCYNADGGGAHLPAGAASCSTATSWSSWKCWPTRRPCSPT